MERRAFVKLAAASPVIVSPVCAGCSDGNPDGDASGTVIGAPSLDPQTGFTFYSPLAEEWYRSGEYFEWTSTTRNNQGRSVNVFFKRLIASGYKAKTITGSDFENVKRGLGIEIPQIETE